VQGSSGFFSLFRVEELAQVNVGIFLLEFFHF